jgi:hypothetical protein
MSTERYTLQYWKGQLDEIWIEQMKMIHRGKNIDMIIELAYGDLISQDDRLKTATASDFKRLVNSWLANRNAEKVSVKRDISKL